MHIFHAAIVRTRTHIKNKNKSINKNDGEVLIEHLLGEIKGMDPDYKEETYMPPAFTPTEQKVINDSVLSIIKRFATSKNIVDIRCFFEPSPPKIMVETTPKETEHFETDTEENKTIDVSDDSVFDDEGKKILTEEEMICSKNLEVYKHLKKRLRSSKDMFESSIDSTRDSINEAIMIWSDSYHEKSECNENCDDTPVLAYTVPALRAATSTTSQEFIFWRPWL